MDTFNLNKKNYLCIVDYHSKFPIINKAENLSADSLILACKISFSKYGLAKKKLSGAGGNFISDKFKQFSKNMNIVLATSSSAYTHQSNGQVSVYKIHKAYCKMYQK